MNNVQAVEQSSKTNVLPSKTILTISPTKKSLYRNQHITLIAKSSSNHKVTWTSNRPNIASVSKNGVVTAIRHGKATITATVDGVRKSCTVHVLSPTIRLKTTYMELHEQGYELLVANVSSGNQPKFKSSNLNIVTVNSKGMLHGINRGTAYITVSEDGTIATCKVIVLEPEPEEWE